MPSQNSVARDESDPIQCVASPRPRQRPPCSRVRQDAVVPDEAIGLLSQRPRTRRDTRRQSSAETASRQSRTKSDASLPHLTDALSRPGIIRPRSRLGRLSPKWVGFSTARVAATATRAVRRRQSRRRSALQSARTAVRGQQASAIPVYRGRRRRDGCPRPGAPFGAGTQRSINTKLSDAHTGHCCASWISSQSRHSFAVRSCMDTSV